MAACPFLKVDKGLEAEADGVSLMKPIPGLDTLLDSGGQARLRHQDALDDQPASNSGIAAIARQQFEIAAQIAKHGLVPILEPEVSSRAPTKPKAEALLEGCAGPASRCAAVGPAR